MTPSARPRSFSEGQEYFSMKAQLGRSSEAGFKLIELQHIKYRRVANGPLERLDLASEDDDNS